MKGRIVRIHNYRDSMDPPNTFGQTWVVVTEDNDQYLLSVSRGQFINFEPDLTKRIVNVTLGDSNDRERNQKKVTKTKSKKKIRKSRGSKK